MSGHQWGPAVGTEGICEGCGRTYVRTTRGQWFHSPKCYRLYGHWAPKRLHFGTPRFDPDRVEAGLGLNKGEWGLR